MDMTERATMVGWLCTFLSITSVAWAISFASVYGPASEKKGAREICALYSEARNTPFCMEIAKQTAQ